MAEGVIPATGRLLIRNASGRVQTLTLDADSARPGRFVRTLANLPASFDYRVRINDAESAEYRVEVLPRPVTTNLVLTQELPAYTGLAPRALEPGDLSVLRGSRLTLAGTASQPLDSAVVRLLGLDGVVTGRVEAARPTVFEGSWRSTIRGLRRFPWTWSIGGASRRRIRRCTPWMSFATPRRRCGWSCRRGGRNS